MTMNVIRNAVKWTKSPVDTAKTVASVAHRTQKHLDSKGNAPRDYFMAYVAPIVRRAKEAGLSEDHIIVAYLHNVVKETDVTLEDLRRLGFDSDQLAAVDAMTHGRDEQDPIAREVRKLIINNQEKLK